MAGLTCKKCGRGQSDIFIFYYGKKIHQKTTSQPHFSRVGFEDRVTGYTEATTTTYQIGGSSQTVLCRSCVTGHRIKAIMNAFVPLAIVLGGGSIWASFQLKELVTVPARFAQYEYHLTSEGQRNLYIYSIIVLGAILLMTFLLIQEARKKRNGGEGLSIHLNTPSLKEQGYDTFWTTDEYYRLQIKSKERSP